MTDSRTRTPIRVAIVDDSPVRSAIVVDGLREAGVTEWVVIPTTASLVRRLVEAAPDVIVISLADPNRDMLEQMFQVSRVVSRPVAMFVDRSDEDMIHAAIEAGISAYVVDGLKKERVKTVVDMAISRFAAFDRLRRELEAARSELQAHKTVDRAKAILMRVRGLSEEEAYTLLRQTAMRERRKLADVAASLVTASALLEKRTTTTSGRPAGMSIGDRAD